MDFNIVNDLLQSKWKSRRLVVRPVRELLKERIWAKKNPAGKRDYYMDGLVSTGK